MQAILIRMLVEWILIPVGVSFDRQIPSDITWLTYQIISQTPREQERILRNDCQSRTQVFKADGRNIDSVDSNTSFRCSMNIEINSRRSRFVGRSGSGGMVMNKAEERHGKCGFPAPCASNNANLLPGLCGVDSMRWWSCVNTVISSGEKETKKCSQFTFSSNETPWRTGSKSFAYRTTRSFTIIPPS